MSIDTVNDLPRRVQYAASASQVDFDYPFPIFTDADLVVYVDDVLQALDVAYTVDGETDDAGGTITFLTPLSGGEVVTIYTDTAIERDTDYQQNGPWDSSSTNDQLDRLTLICRELKDKIGRCIRWPFTASQTSTALELSPIANWYGKFLKVSDIGLFEAADLISSVVAISADVIGGLIYPALTLETDVGLTPTNRWYEYGDMRRYNVVFDSTNSGDMSTNAQQFNLVVQAFKNSGYTIRIRGGQAFHFSTQLLIAAGADTSCRINFDQDANCTLYSHVAGSVDQATFNNAGFGILFDGWRDSRWAGWSLNADAGTAGAAFRCRNQECSRNEFTSPRLDGGDVAADKNDRTRIVLRFIGNESTFNAGYATYWNKFVGGHIQIGQKLVEYLVGDGNAATRQPNAQIFIGTNLSRYWVAHELNDTDEHFITGSWHDNAPGAVVGTASSLTQSAGTATLSLTDHGLLTDDLVQISGATPTDYNGVARITKTGSGTFTYVKTNGVAIPSGTTSPATGTITVTRLSVGYYGDTTYSQIGANVEAGANAISYFIKDGGAGGNLIQIIDNNSINSVVEDQTEQNLILDRQFIDSSGQVSLRVNRVTRMAVSASAATLSVPLLMPPVTFTSTDATPSVAGGNTFITAGTTAITDFDDGVLGQTIVIKATGNITITHNASIIALAGAGNFSMTADDTLELTMFVDQVWTETGRSVN